MESKHQDLNVYTIKPLSGKDPMHMVNQWQLFDLQKSQGDNLLDQTPDTNLPIMLAKKTLWEKRLPKEVICMVPGPRPK